MISKTTEYIVYESPDGGETVYMRNSGHDIRQLHSTSDKHREKVAELKQSQLWLNIRMAAKKNPTLQAALDHCIMLYKLTEDHEKDV